jgi:hypothetical protein
VSLRLFEVFFGLASRSFWLRSYSEAVMTLCYQPRPAFMTAEGKVVFREKPGIDVSHSISLPCGQCIACRKTKAAQLSARIQHEARMHDTSKFLTLTYDDEHRRLGGSLHYPDFQSFMRRLRYARPDQNLRFAMCGEYGDRTGREHFHAAIFGLSFNDGEKFKANRYGQWIYTSEELSKLWPHGHSSFAEMDEGTAHYLAQYAVKKITGERAKEHYRFYEERDGNTYDRRPPFFQSSRRPGIGATFLEEFGADIAALGHCRMPSGQVIAMPRYYEDKLKLIYPDLIGQHKEAKQDFALRHSEKRTDEYLHRRESFAKEVLKAKKRTSAQSAL